MNSSGPSAMLRKAAYLAYRSMHDPVSRWLPETWRWRLSALKHRVRYGAILPARLEKINAQLRCAVANRPSLLVLPLVSWYSMGFQRPQQLARAYAATGGSVVFVEPWAPDMLPLSPEARRAREFVGVREVEPNLHVVRLPYWLLAEYVRAGLTDAVLMSWPDHAHLVARDTPSLVVYEMIDDHSLGKWPGWWKRLHRDWVRRADLMAASADNLVDQLLPLRPDTFLLPNAVSLDDWRLEENAASPIPDDLAAARAAPVVVGYYGALANWFDWELWDQIVSSRPQWSFVLIGFPFHLTERYVRQRMARHSNAFYLGPKPYHELPRYMVHVDVATIPFRLNDVTHGCSPLKLFEYMAAGKPIVATRMREILKYSSVLFADGPHQFAQRLDEALTRRDDPAYQAVLAAESRANTWQARASRLREAIQAARSVPPELQPSQFRSPVTTY